MEKRTTFVDFLIQLIFIILFVILLVWLFPTKDWLKENYFNNGEYNYERETIINDSKYVDNINNMLEASKSYFGYDVNLPENIGDTVSVTLDELVNNHIMIMPKNSKGKKCDRNSTSVITKTESGYTIKVELTCGSDSDYIIRNVGCDPFCKDNCNQRCTLEYEYSKKTEGYYTNWSNWSAWSTVKRTAGENIKVEEKYIKTKICPSGYTLNSKKTACVKVVKDTKEEDAKETRTCPSGYEFDKDGSKCIRNSSSTREVDANITYSCKDGYTLTKDNKCIKTENISKETDANVKYTCSSGYTLNNNKCYNYETINSTVSTRNVCKSGFAYVGKNTCTSVTNRNLDPNIYKGVKCSVTYEMDCNNECKVIEKETCTMPSTLKHSYSCPSGYELSSDKKTCSKTTIENAKVEYYCNNGTLSGTKCIITETKVDTIESNYSYSCKEGTLKGSKCIVENNSEEVKDVEIKYSCTEGELKGNKCIITTEKTESTKYTEKSVLMYRYSTRKYVKETISYKWSTSKNDKKLIDAGYKLTGKTRKNCK